MAVNAHRENPRPAANEAIAARAAPPAPTGAITLPTQLIRFSHVPSGCAPVCPCTATFTCGAWPRFCAISPASVATSRARTRATGSARRHDLSSLIGLISPLPPRVDLGHARKLTRFRETCKQNCARPARALPIYRLSQGRVIRIGWSRAESRAQNRSRSVVGWSCRVLTGRRRCVRQPCI
jgi:hypothetical protein